MKIVTMEGGRKIEENSYKEGGRLKKDLLNKQNLKIKQKTSQGQGKE